MMEKKERKFDKVKTKIKAGRRMTDVQGKGPYEVLDTYNRNAFCADESATLAQPKFVICSILTGDYDGHIKLQPMSPFVYAGEGENRLSFAPMNKAQALVKWDEIVAKWEEGEEKKVVDKEVAANKVKKAEIRHGVFSTLRDREKVLIADLRTMNETINDGTKLLKDAKVNKAVSELNKIQLLIKIL